ncbi:MAG TPA: hypothetical protein VLD67_02950 [Vicinamibacterales bacterium]|nr:hypothetical protein [Vicinamibacterales bacterium]
MIACAVQQSGRVELYFYGELEQEAAAELRSHMSDCGECRRALEELTVIRAALATRPDICEPADGDWTGFMERLDDRLQRERTARAAPVREFRGALPILSPARRLVVPLSMAALLALATTSVFYVARSRPMEAPREPLTADVAPGGLGPSTWSAETGFASLSEQHFERSKLVVLGLINKDPHGASPADWEYERQLASALLSDTRLYRQAAEARGLTRLARVMSDLELVLLQASLSRTPEPETLEQIQRLIQKRDLVTKMNVVARAGP